MSDTTKLNTGKDKSEIPTFNVLSLGLSGAGKTVFLASMYHRLMVYNEKRGFYLRCPDWGRSQQLLSSFEDVADADRDWPMANQAVQEYEFDCVYPNKYADIALCKFKYVDFPGGFLKAQGAYEGFDLAGRARSADSILVLLDGKKIKDKLDGTAKGNNILSDVLSIVPLLSQCVGAEKPIHFLITKSDLLNPKTHSISNILDLLFLVGPFRDLIEQQCRHSTVRMVPVSSVGDNFAKFNDKTGEMEKISGAEINPFNVDLSLALTLYDHLKKLYSEIDSNTQKMINKGQSTLKIIEAIQAVSGKMRMFSPVSSFAGFVGLEGSALTWAVRQFDSALLTKHDQVQRELQSIHRTISDKKTAFAGVCAIQNLYMQRFEQLLPASNVNKRFISHA